MSRVTSDDALRSVNIHLSDVKDLEPTANRIISLSSPWYELKIGRGSQSEQCLRPHESNAWFTARVMSRDHAVLRADPETKKLTIEDAGSMHGTYIDGVRLESGKPVAVLDNTVIRFGTEIVRGEFTYFPLELQLNYAWCDNSARVATYSSHQNSFSFDYSDEEENEEDVKFVYESGIERRRGRNRQSRTFSVPESEDSESSHNLDNNQEESAISSPIDGQDMKDKDNISSAVPALVTFPEEVLTVHSITPGSSMHNALNVSDDEEDHTKQDKSASEPREHMNADEAEESEDDDEEEYEESMADGDDDDDDDDEEVDEDEEDVLEDELDRLESDDGMGREEEGQQQPPPPPSPPVLDTQNKLADAPLRDPSPSDAALPKSWVPSAIPSMTATMDQPSLGFYHTNTFPTGMPNPSSQSLNYYGGMNWPANENSHGIFGPYEHSYIPQLAMGAPYPWRSVPSCSRNADESQVTARPYTPKISSKVSINNIIDEVQTEFPIDDNSVARKRKADEISQSVPEEGQEESLHSVVSQTHQAEAELEPLSEPSWTTDETIQQATTDLDATSERRDIQQPTEVEESVAMPPVVATYVEETRIDEEERPRKIAKIEHDGGENRFLRYAAAVVAGATVGAVGTVFGLAALPADYFA